MPFDLGEYLLIFDIDRIELPRPHIIQNVIETLGITIDEVGPITVASFPSLSNQASEEGGVEAKQCLFGCLKSRSIEIATKRW